MELGFTIQYHLRQLMSNNEYVSYPGLFEYAIPIVEFPLEIGTVRGNEEKSLEL